jgi:hypothetical protein
LLRAGNAALVRIGGGIKLSELGGVASESVTRILQSGLDTASLRWIEIRDDSNIIEGPTRYPQLVLYEAAGFLKR